MRLRFVTTVAFLLLSAWPTLAQEAARVDEPVNQGFVKERQNPTALTPDPYISGLEAGPAAAGVIAAADEDGDNALNVEELGKFLKLQMKVIDIDQPTGKQPSGNGNTLAGWTGAWAQSNSITAANASDDQVFSAAVAKSFDTWDANGDDMLSNVEIGDVVKMGR